MNVNFVYSDFSDNGRALPNCSAQHPNFHWFDSTNFLNVMIISNYSTSYEYYDYNT